MIAARAKFREVGTLGAVLPEPYRIVGVKIGRLLLFGVYMPNLRLKVPYWEALIAALAAEAARPALAIGDFNTCRAYVDERGAIDVTAHFMETVETIGFLRFVAAALSQRPRVFVVQHARQRLSHRPRVPVAPARPPRGRYSLLT